MLNSRSIGIINFREGENLIIKNVNAEFPVLTVWHQEAPYWYSFMSLWINKIDGVMVAVEVGMLAEIGIPRDEPSHLSIVVPCSDVAQSCVAFRSVAACRSVHIGTGAAACRADCAAKSVEVDGSDDGLAAIGDGSLMTRSVIERNFAVLANQGIAVGVSRRCRATLLLQQNFAAHEVECGRGSARCPRESPAERIIGKRSRVAALRDARQLSLIIVVQRVRRA
jgi:hypothetical protein